MSDTTAPTQANLLLDILVTFLTPLFLVGPAGTLDTANARAAAIEAISAFRIRNTWDLITAVQVVAFAMGALGSMSLSMDDSLSLSAVLRCRSNANALQRASDRARDRLEGKPGRAGQDGRFAPDAPPEDPPEPPDDALTEESLRMAAEAQQHVARAKANLAALRQAETAQEAAGAGIPQDHPRRLASRELERQVAWATGMADVAGECAEEMRTMPKHEQRLHQIRIQALAGVAKHLCAGNCPDPWTLPLPPRAVNQVPPRMASPPPGG